MGNAHGLETLIAAAGLANRIAVGQVLLMARSRKEKIVQLAATRDSPTFNFSPSSLANASRYILG